MIDANTIHHSDIFDLCAKLDDASVDMILCDLPYGTTACSWDNVIPFEPMWEAFKRVIKPRGAIVLTASQPFTSALIMSNVKAYRHSWVWDKKLGSNYALMNYQPFKIHEDVIVFGFEPPNYYPIKSQDKPYVKEVNKTSRQQFNDNLSLGALCINSGDRFPKSIITFTNANKNESYHPTQKPVALFEYLIKTYTQPDALIFDPCAGSGTTAIASLKCDRRYIVGDSSQEYVTLMQKRVNAWDVTQPTQIDENTTQLNLFEVLS